MRITNKQLNKTIYRKKHFKNIKYNNHLNFSLMNEYITTLNIISVDKI